MGFDKLLAPLGDSFVLQKTLDSFQLSPLISEIVVVTTDERFAKLQREPHVHHCEGDIERHLSVNNGLISLKDQHDYIAVHDGARPLFTEDQFKVLLDSLEDNQAVTSARRITDTMKRTDDQGFCVEPVDRENLWAMETPQVFHAEFLIEAYQHVIENNLLVTDEVSALEKLFISTKCVSNAVPNPKITYPEDLEFTSQLIDFYVS